MSDRSAPPTEDPLRWVSDELVHHAAAAGMDVVPAPNLVGPGLGRAEAAAAVVEPRDLPSVARGIKLGRYAVVLGLLPDATGDREIADTMRRYRNQCVVARSKLSPTAALDLTLILVGPRGSASKDSWQSVALGVERDDRVSRKLVWLRPDEPRADAASLASFVKRTFLARPWDVEAVFSVATLDAVSVLTEPDDLPQDTVGKWTKLASEIRDDPEALVAALVAAWSERSAT